MTKSKVRAKNKKKGNRPAIKSNIKLFPIGRIGEIVFYSIVMFILGVLTGRGTAPVHFDLKHEKELKAIYDVEKRLEPVNVKLDFSKKLELDGDIKIDKDLIKKTEIDKVPEKTPRFKGEKKKVKLFVEPLSEKEELKEEPKKKELKTEKKKEIEKISKSDKFSFTVQVAALKDSKDADELASDLRANGFAAYSISGKSDDGSLWFRVRVGKLSNRDEALEVKEQLLNEMNINGLLLKLN
jgi:cell division septation protein DedD